MIFFVELEHIPERTSHELLISEPKSTQLVFFFNPK
jgi:hypothetical protein